MSHEHATEVTTPDDDGVIHRQSPDILGNFKPAPPPKGLPKIKSLSDPAVMREIMWDSYVRNPETRYALMLLSQMLSDGDKEVVMRLIFTVPIQRREKVISKITIYAKRIAVAYQQGKKSPFSERMNSLAKMLRLSNGRTEEEQKEDKRSLADLQLLREIYTSPRNVYAYKKTFSPLFVTRLLNC